MYIFPSYNTAVDYFNNLGITVGPIKTVSLSHFPHGCQRANLIYNGEVIGYIEAEYNEEPEERWVTNISFYNRNKLPAGMVVEIFGNQDTVPGWTNQFFAEPQFFSKFTMDDVTIDSRGPYSHVIIKLDKYLKATQLDAYTLELKLKYDPLLTDISNDIPFKVLDPDNYFAPLQHTHNVEDLIATSDDQNKILSVDDTGTPFWSDTIYVNDDKLFIDTKDINTYLTDFNNNYLSSDYYTTNFSNNIRHVLEDGEQNGITVTYDSINDVANFKTNDFTITLQGDVIGNGSVVNLHDVVIQTTMNTIPTGLQNVFVAKNGDTMNGPLYLNDDPQSSMEAATKRYVDNKTYDQYFEKTGGTITGDVVIAGDLNVLGATNTIHETDLIIDNNMIILNNGEIGSGVSEGKSGISVDRGTALNALLYWDETIDRWQIGTEGDMHIIATEDELITLLGNYYTKTESDDRYVNVTGDTMTGMLVMDAYPLRTVYPSGEPNIQFTKQDASANNKNSEIKWSDGYFMFSTYNDDWSFKQDIFKIQNNGAIKLYNYILGSSTAQSTRLQSDHGWVDIGAQDDNYLHFYTDRPEYYFDKEIEVDGIIKVYNHDSYLGVTNAHIDGVNLYTGSTNPSSTTRFNIDAYLYATRVYQAVYNDYAEAFTSGLNYKECKNLIVEIDNGDIKLASKLSNRVIGVVSDSYAMLIGGSQDDIENNRKLPIALAGSVWVKSSVDVTDNDIGRVVVCDGDGKGIAVEFDIKYYGRIVGKIIGVDKAKNMYKIIVSLM